MSSFFNFIVVPCLRLSGKHGWLVGLSWWILPSSLEPVLSVINGFSSTCLHHQLLSKHLCRSYWRASVLSIMNKCSTQSIIAKGS
ncbi:hypothetical protein QBC47DRAFT_387720 [Echria macrotheca]|uniref:Uncharacterized protein n=1 Tax=Echria macrotheca TaxID=438768 RepID=A0AAJ0B7F1_9PEZI|nr:hypothetical protein QBC47DRAFT_387720 [Echria macrotheca]